MAKAARVYSGYDSYGRQLQRAERVDGTWFGRHTIRDPHYGPRLTKWSELDEVPTFETHCVNEYDGETYEYNEPRMSCGFALLERLDFAVRLPNKSC